MDPDDGSSPPPPDPEPSGSGAEDASPPPPSPADEPAPTAGTGVWWWLEPGETVLHQEYAGAVYQSLEAESSQNDRDEPVGPNLFGTLRGPVRRRFRARFHVTDRRLVAVRGRRPSRRQRALPVDVPLHRLSDIEVVSVLRSSGASSRTWPGRRFLRMEVALQHRRLLLGINLRTADAESWASALSAGQAEAPPDD